MTSVDHEYMVRPCSSCGGEALTDDAFAADELYLWPIECDACIEEGLDEDDYLQIKEITNHVDY